MDIPISQITAELCEVYGFDAETALWLVRMIFGYRPDRISDEELRDICLSAGFEEHVWCEAARRYPNATHEVVFHLYAEERYVLLSFVSSPTNDKATVSTTSNGQVGGDVATKTRLWRKSVALQASRVAGMIRGESHVPDPRASAERETARTLLSLLDDGYVLTKRTEVKRLGT